MVASLPLPPAPQDASELVTDLPSGRPFPTGQTHADPPRRDSRAGRSAHPGPQAALAVTPCAATVARAADAGRQNPRACPPPLHPVSIASLLTISGPFDSLFKVLFIFPSQYLFTIGLLPVFSLRWRLPPLLRCTPKQRDSPKTPHLAAPRAGRGRDCHPLRYPVPGDFYRPPPPKTLL